MTPHAARSIGVLAPRLVAAGLIELLRTDAWDPAPWALQLPSPTVLVAWCRDDDPVAFARTIAERANCPLIVISHLDRAASLPRVTCGDHDVRFLDLHVPPQNLLHHVEAVARGFRPAHDRAARSSPCDGVLR